MPIKAQRTDKQTDTPYLVWECSFCSRWYLEEIDARDHEAHCMHRPPPIYDHIAPPHNQPTEED